jgi:hypothetical protein
VAKFTLALVAAALCFNSGAAQSRNRATAGEKEALFRLIRRDKDFVALLAQFAGSPAETEELARSSAQTMSVTKVDLNGDGQPEYIAEVGGRDGVFCGALANCPRWIFRKTRGGFERIGFDGGSRSLTPRKTTTRGYRDLRAVAGDTAVEDAVFIYKYDGREYRATDCFTRDWSGPRVKLRRVKCEE